MEWKGNRCLGVAPGTCWPVCVGREEMGDVLREERPSLYGDPPYMETILIWRPSLYGDPPYMETLVIWRPSLYGDPRYMESLLIWRHFSRLYMYMYIHLAPGIQTSTKEVVQKHSTPLGITVILHLNIQLICYRYSCYHRSYLLPPRGAIQILPPNPPKLIACLLK